jgi:hypothetical protein
MDIMTRLWYNLCHGMMHAYILNLGESKVKTTLCVQCVVACAPGTKNNLTK